MVLIVSLSLSISVLYLDYLRLNDYLPSPKLRVKTANKAEALLDVLGNSTEIFADEIDEEVEAEIAREEIEVVEMEVRGENYCFALQSNARITYPNHFCNRLQWLHLKKLVFYFSTSLYSQCSTNFLAKPIGGL